MNCKEYCEKYKDQKKDFFTALKSWLKMNPERFIAYRTYIPGYADNGYSTPCVKCIGAAPGFLDECFVSSNGTIYDLYVWDEEGEDLTDWDRKYLSEREDWDYKRRALEAEHELEAVLCDGFDAFIGRWDVDGKISLVDGELKFEEEDNHLGV